MIILIAIAFVAVCAPLAGVVLVSVASHREDSACSLGGQPSGSIEAAGRRLVGFHGDGVDRWAGGRPAVRADRRTAALAMTPDFLTGTADKPHLAA